MKKLLSLIGVVTSAVFAFSSCNRELAVNDSPVKEKVTFTFTAEKAGEETRTEASEGSESVSYLWTDEDVANMHLYLITQGTEGEVKTEIAAEDLTINISSDYTQMTITAKVDEADTYTFRAVLASAFSINGNPKVKASQSPKVDNYDPTADLLVSEDLTTDTPSNMLMTFNRKAVINKMTLKGLTAGEKVRQVVITSNQYLNGTWDGSKFTSNQDNEKTITLSYPNIEIGDNNQFPVYFTSIPKNGHTLTVTVITDAKKYTKTFGGSIALNQGSFTRFSVTMPAGIVVDSIEGVYYIAAKPANANWFLMDFYCTSQSTGYYAGIETTINKTATEVEGSDFVDISDYQNYFWDVKAVEGGGYTIQNLHTELYLACTSGNSNYASYKESPDETTLFNITVSNTAIIRSVEYSERVLNYNSGGSSNRFAFYTNTQNPVYLIPAYNDGLTAVRLSFDEATINTSTNDYANVTGQTLHVDPDLTVITDAITYSMEGDPIGAVDASTGAVALNGTAGTATVTATFPGNSIYRTATASYTIIVTASTNVMYKIVSSLDEVTDGTYVIVNAGYYLPNVAATSAGPAKNDNTKATISGDYVINVSDDMTWNFSGTTDAMIIKSSIPGDYYLVVSGKGNSNLRVNTTAGRTWTIDNYPSTSGAFTLKDNTQNRFCASYLNDWRSYDSYNNSNYNDGGRIYLYKLIDNRPQVSTPVISPEPGAINSGTEVTISCSTEGATIHYTVDGSAPTAESATYSGPITVTAPTTVKAIAVKDGFKDSDIATAAYTINVVNTSTEANPYSPAEADALAGQLVANGTLDAVYVRGIISSITESYNPNYSNTSFNISADGLTTGTQFLIFRAAASSASDFKIGDAVEFKGRLINYQVSGQSTTTHELQAGSQNGGALIYKVSAPIISPNGGDFEESQTVTISADQGATIRYTIDGTTPTATIGTEYSDALSLTETTTVKAISIKDGIATGVVSAIFTKDNGGDAPTSVSYDFTGDDWSVSNGILTNGTVSFSGKGDTNFKMNTGYFMMGKSGAYINFPEYSYPVTKIVVTGKSGASGSVKQNVFVGDAAVSTETTGATGINTYNIASANQAAGTIYTLKVTSSHNTQITMIEVFFGAN